MGCRLLLVNVIYFGIVFMDKVLDGCVSENVVEEIGYVV